MVLSLLLKLRCRLRKLVRASLVRECGLLPQTLQKVRCMSVVALSALVLYSQQAGEQQKSKRPLQISVGVGWLAACSHGRFVTPGPWWDVDGIVVSIDLLQKDHFGGLRWLQ